MYPVGYSFKSGRYTTGSLTDIENYILSSIENSFGGPLGKQLKEVKASVKENTDEALTLEFLVPGIDPKDIKVTFEGKQLSVETPNSRFKKEFDQKFSPEGSTAVAKHGVLTVRLLKCKESSYEISVTAE
jgi:HSP20 family molecular chaperone IbpA